MIASDIHGSAYYCKKLLDLYGRTGADRLLLLGDILYHGPRNDLPEDYSPKKVAEMLNGYSDAIFCVRGNCEAEVDQLMLKFPVMADYALIPLGDRIIFATHGHLYNTNKLPPHKHGDILLHGHTHIPVCEQADGMTYVNPGSVSIPKNGSEHSCILYENGVFRWLTLDGTEYCVKDLS